jgi:hypothetical protein
MDEARVKTILRVKKISRTVLLVIGAFWFGFGMFSGAESFGGGFRGVLTNLPNALPWFLLLVFVYLSWYFEIVGSILVLLAGAATIIFFDALGHPVVFVLITLPILALGTALLVSSLWIRRLKQGT